MSIKNRIKAAGFAAVFITSIVSLPAAAAMNPYDWDGESPLSSDWTYYISDNVTVRGNYSLPENSTILLKEGASITVSENSTLETLGSIYVEDGASVIVSGGMNIAEGSVISVKGMLASDDKSQLSVKGDLLCHSGAAVSFDGTTTVAQTARLVADCDLLLGGSYDNRAQSSTYNGNVDIKGVARLSGLTTFNKNLTIGDDAEVTNSGIMTLAENCRYSMTGSFRNTESGTVTDNRRKYDEDAATVSRLSLYTGKQLKGIDVSVWQGEIDWAKVKASGLVDFAIIRSSRGPLSESDPSKADDMLYANLVGAAQNDISVGVYHYCYGETVEQVREEAKFVLSLIDGYDISYPVIFDIEDPWYQNNNYTKETLTDMAIAFCEEIKKAGYMPMVYSYASFFDSHLDTDRLKEYPVWVAHVDTDKPAYDKDYFMWQYSWEGSVDGIEGYVDLDYAYVDFESYIRENKLNGLE